MNYMLRHSVELNSLLLCSWEGSVYTRVEVRCVVCRCDVALWVEMGCVCVCVVGCGWGICNFSESVWYLGLCISPMVIRRENSTSFELLQRDCCVSCYCALLLFVASEAAILMPRRVSRRFDWAVCPGLVFTGLQEWLSPCSTNTPTHKQMYAHTHTRTHIHALIDSRTCSTRTV